MYIMVENKKEKEKEEIILIYNSYEDPCSKCPFRGLCKK